MFTMTLGVDLVLTARRGAAACKGVEIEIIAADLGKPDAARVQWPTYRRIPK